jgi:hypothetical protein
LRFSFNHPEKEFIMLESAHASFAQSEGFVSEFPASRVSTPAPMKEERLPFRVRLARSEGDVQKAVHVRHSAYARHVPALAEKLLQPEETDYADGVAVLLAESKLDGSPLGTMRIQTNRHQPLSLEQSVALPGWIKGATLAEATRLGVDQGQMGSLAKAVLFKAFYLYCLDAGIDWMVITARRPLDRQYENLMFDDLHPGGGYVPMRHVGNIPHRVMCFEVATAAARWEQARHPLFAFMTQTAHPDIQVAAAPRPESVQPSAPPALRKPARAPSLAGAWQFA